MRDIFSAMAENKNSLCESRVENDKNLALSRVKRARSLRLKKKHFTAKNAGVRRKVRKERPILLH